MMETDALYKEIQKLVIVEENPLPSVICVEKSPIRKATCPHREIILEGHTKNCAECGEVLLIKELTYEKEWRYYGMMDTRHTSDPNRCHIRRSEDKTIYRDVDKMGFSDKIISMANHLYEQVTQGRIFRGNTRKGIIFACIFHAYKLELNPQSCETLIDIFQIDRKIGLRGLKFVNLHAPKDSTFRNFQITTEHLIQEILNKFHASPPQVQEAIQLYHTIKGRSSLLNRSRPQSVASGVVRYYIQLKNPDITMDYFRTKIRLSELTISRIVKEIRRLVEIV